MQILQRLRRRWLYFRLTLLACRIAKLEIRLDFAKLQFREVNEKLKTMVE